ncbi:hypothetical protein [Sorangium sp. So ce1078]|uniref:hypothetical protein n=1 Tax=Sorangium sp. So ce1078 TaxID=3133329 RepID=UPI003F62E2BD
MIELTFKLTPEDGDARDVLVRIHEPTRNPPEKKWPWAAPVEVDGRQYSIYGMDPLDAIENGARHAAILLHGVHGDALDPSIEPRMKEGQ